MKIDDAKRLACEASLSEAPPHAGPLYVFQDPHSENSPEEAFEWGVYLWLQRMRIPASAIVAAFFQGKEYKLQAILPHRWRCSQCHAETISIERPEPLPNPNGHRCTFFSVPPEDPTNARESEAFFGAEAEPKAASIKEIEIDYFNGEGQIRTIRLSVESGTPFETQLPFLVRQHDRRFSKIKKWKEVAR